MTLRVTTFENQGDLSKECVWIDVEVPTEINRYMLGATHFMTEATISTRLGGTFWFPAKTVAAGDLIKIMTGEGKNAVVANNRGTSTHVFFWNLPAAIWDKRAACAVLFTVTAWNATAPPSTSVSPPS